MTVKELAEKLENPEDFAKFRHAIGGEGQTPQWYLDNFARRHELLDGVYSRYFELLTEQERVNQAHISGAEAAKQSAEAARESARHAEEANKIAKESLELAKEAKKGSGQAKIIAWIGVVVAVVTVIAKIIEALAKL